MSVLDCLSTFHDRYSSPSPALRASCPYNEDSLNRNVNLAYTCTSAHLILYLYSYILSPFSKRQARLEK